MINYTRNTTEGNDFPFITQYAGFDSSTYCVNLQWNLENLFVNTFERGPISINVYPVDGDLVIVGDELQPFDHYHLERATDYNSYVMPNGMLLIDYYSKHIVDIYDHLDTLDNANKRGSVLRRTSDTLVDPLEVKVNRNHQQTYIGVRFYDENDDPVVASSGSIQLAGVNLVGGVLTDIPDGILDATSPAPVTALDRPYERIVATPEGLDGIDHWQLIVWQI